MISLVGIISGLLAKDVIETIAASGRKILQRNALDAQQDSGRIEGDSSAAAPK